MEIMYQEEVIEQLKYGLNVYKFIYINFITK